MTYESIERPAAHGQGSLATDFGLIFDAVADAFRGFGGHQQDGYWTIQRRRCENC